MPNSHGNGVIERYEIDAEVRKSLARSSPAFAQQEEDSKEDGTKGGVVFEANAFILGAARTQVDVQRYPFRAVAFVRINIPVGFPLRGTAFFVSERILVTAAHNLPPDLISIEVYVEFDGNASSQPFVTKNFRVAPGYPGDTRHDFGVIILAQDVGQATGWFEPPTNPASPPNGTIVTMSGYPAPGLVELEGTGPTLNVTGDTLSYAVNTMRGDSGAPVFLDVDPDPILVGIHRAEKGIAVPMTPQVSQQILAWIASA